MTAANFFEVGRRCASLYAVRDLSPTNLLCGLRICPNPALISRAQGNSSQNQTNLRLAYYLLGHFARHYEIIVIIILFRVVADHQSGVSHHCDTVCARRRARLGAFSLTNFYMDGADYRTVRGLIFSSAGTVYKLDGVMTILWPNKSLQPTRGIALGSSRSRGLFYVAVPAWLSSSR
jgi:hypothetical protein